MEWLIPRYLPDFLVGVAANAFSGVVRIVVFAVRPMTWATEEAAQSLGRFCSLLTDLVARALVVVGFLLFGLAVTAVMTGVAIWLVRRPALAGR